jgi:hypothetical protein
VTLSQATIDGALIAAGAAVVGFVAAFTGNILSSGAGNAARRGERGIRRSLSCSCLWWTC